MIRRRLRTPGQCLNGLDVSAVQGLGATAWTWVKEHKVAALAGSVVLAVASGFFSRMGAWFHDKWRAKRA